MLSSISIIVIFLGVLIFVIAALVLCCLCCHLRSRPKNEQGNSVNYLPHGRGRSEKETSVTELWWPAVFWCAPFSLFLDWLCLHFFFVKILCFKAYHQTAPASILNIFLGVRRSKRTFNKGTIILHCSRQNWRGKNPSMNCLFTETVWKWTL